MPWGGPLEEMRETKEKKPMASHFIGDVSAHKLAFDSKIHYMVE
jgi:hypothetical protein